MPLSALWARLFGPSTTDRLLEVLREDRATQAALVTKMLDAIQAQSDLAARQLALLTPPAGPAEVRVMTDADEAHFERQRLARKATSTTLPARTIDPDALLDELARDFARESAHGL